MKSTQGDKTMTKTKKVIRTVVVAGVLCSLASIATFSAFSSQADNPGNTVTAGTVALADNDSGTALYSMAAAKPGDAVTKCIKVSYTGTLDASVKFYSPSAIGTLGQYVNLKIEPGTQSGAPAAGDCTGYTADGGNLFNAALNTMPTTYAAGLADNPGTTATKWVNGDSVAYRVTATLAASAPDAAQGLTTGSHVLRWESQNQ
jgi:predicted ribosomally synthesized peptide with SipW-like signal peptide